MNTHNTEPKLDKLLVLEKVNHYEAILNHRVLTFQEHLNYMKYYKQYLDLGLNRGI